MTDPAQADAAVLEFLAAHGEGGVVLEDMARATGLPRVTIRTSLLVLRDGGSVCYVEAGEEYGTTRYVILHLHPAGNCDQE